MERGGTGINPDDFRRTSIEQIQKSLYRIEGVSVRGGEEAALKQGASYRFIGWTWQTPFTFSLVSQHLQQQLRSCHLWVISCSAL